MTGELDNGLLPQHLELIRASAISDDVARARGYRSITKSSALKELGFAPSQAAARQLVSHGHVRVNGRRVDVPSFQLRAGQVIELSEKLRKNLLVQESLQTASGRSVPEWLEFDSQSFKVTVKEYGLTPALPSLLVLRRRSREELIRTEHPEYKVFMAVVDRAGVDARGNLLFQRAPDGEVLIFDEEVVERVREGGKVEIRRITRRNRRIHDELPLVAEKFKEFQETGKVTS